MPIRCRKLISSFVCNFVAMGVVNHLLIRECPSFSVIPVYLFVDIFATYATENICVGATSNL